MSLDMRDDHDAGLLFPSTGTCQAFTQVSGAAVELRRFAWRNSIHEGSFAVPRSFIELTDVSATGGYHANQPEWWPLGPMRFYPGHRRFYSKWMDDEQTSLLCALDFKRLTGSTPDLDSRRLHECGNIRNDYLRALLIRIRNELVSPGFASDLVIETACGAAAAELHQHFATPSRGLRRRGDRMSRHEIGRTAQRIRCGEIPLSLDQMARSRGLSTRQFTRLFQQESGESYSRFCARHLALRGQDLLTDGTLLVKEVAYLCGFANTASFTRAFRRETGYSPKQFRERPRLNPRH